MRSEEEIRKEIERIANYKKKWPCAPDIRRECDMMIDLLKWVLESDEKQEN